MVKIMKIRRDYIPIIMLLCVLGLALFFNFRAETRIRELEMEVADLITENDYLKSQYGELNAKYNNAMYQLSLERQKTRSLQRDLEEWISAYNRLKKDYDDVFDLYNRVKSKYEQLMKEYKALLSRTSPPRSKYLNVTIVYISKYVDKVVVEVKNIGTEPLSIVKVFGVLLIENPYEHTYTLKYDVDDIKQLYMNETNTAELWFIYFGYKEKPKHLWIIAVCKYEVKVLSVEIKD